MWITSWKKENNKMHICILKQTIMNNNNAHVDVINYKDVRGNELKYLQIQVGDKIHLINIGNKTYDAVNKLLNGGNEQQQPTPRKEVKK